MKFFYKRKLRFGLSMCMLAIMLIQIPAMAAVPGVNAKVTKKNLLRLMKYYDSDSYYILKKQSNRGADFSSWLEDADTLVEAAEVAVHEEYHNYSYSEPMYLNQEELNYYLVQKVYLGGKTNRLIRQTDVPKTELATRTISKKYRTFRFDAYVGSDSYLSSNQQGIYGLFNELTAYYHGMHTMNSLFPYIKKHAKSKSDYVTYVNAYLNDRDAYAEFYYWMLTYLKYMRSHSKKTYQSILDNREFVLAFKKIQGKYAKEIKKGKKNLRWLAKKYNNGDSFSESYQDGVFKLGNIGIATDDAYDLLIQEINSKSFKTVNKELKAKYKKFK